MEKCVDNQICTIDLNIQDIDKDCLDHIAIWSSKSYDDSLFQELVTADYF